MANAVGTKVHVGANVAVMNASRRMGRTKAKGSYCEDGQCILVPTICRNVSRISRTDVPAERIVAAAPAGAVLPPAASDRAPADLAPDPGPSSFAALSDPAASEGNPPPAASAAPGAGDYPGVVVIGGGPTGAGCAARAAGARARGLGLDAHRAGRDGGGAMAAPR